MIARAEPITELAPANGKAPAEGSVTAKQSPAFGPPWLTTMTGGLLCAPGADYGNPLGYPDWSGRGYWGTYGVYRWILQHPMIRAVRERVFGTVCSSPWAVETDDDVPAEAKDFVSRRFSEVHDESMPEFLRCLDYGHSCFEPVWEQDEDGNYCVCFKPLWPEYTSIIEDYAGQFIGFQASLRSDLTDAQRKAADVFVPPVPAGTNGKARPVRPNLPAAAFKALLISYDGEAGNHWGRSQLENLREKAWKPWLLCAQQLAQLGSKISGIQAYGLAPEMDLPGGSTVKKELEKGLSGFVRGKTFVGPAFYVSQPLGKGAEEKVIPAIEVKVVDFGSNAPAISGLLEQMGHYETLMWHGYLQSPRSGMESEHGSRADAQQHSSNDTLFCERLANFVTRRIQPFVDEVCRLNWGLKRGKVRLKQSQISDPDLEFKRQFWLTLAANQAGAPIVLQGTGLTELQGQLRIPPNKSLKGGGLEKLVTQQQEQDRQDKLDAAKAALAAKGNNAPPGTPANNPAGGKAAAE